MHGLIEKDLHTYMHHNFQRIQSVIGLTNSNTTWALALLRVELILLVVENKIACAFITKVIPSFWCLYLSTRVCHDNQHTFPHLIVHYTWHNCIRQPTPRHDIRHWVSRQSHQVCQIESVAMGHITQLQELRILRCHAPTGSDLYINNHQNVVIRLACCCFHIAAKLGNSRMGNVICVPYLCSSWFSVGFST